MNIINEYYGRLIQEVSADEFKQIERIAGILSENKQIRNNSVRSLARAFCFVKVNEFFTNRANAGSLTHVKRP
jgi:hypothetical protein